MSAGLSLCLLLAGAEPLFDAPAGPRISYQAEEVPLRVALLELGRRLNRSFEGPLLTADRTGLRPVSLDLREATVAEVLAAVEEVSEGRLTRRSRTRYVLNPSNQRLALVGEPLGAWRLWLRSVSYNLVSTLDPADPARRYARAWIYTTFSLEAPDDMNAVRIRRLIPPDRTGVPAGALPNDSEVTAPDAADPRFWSARFSALPPPPDVPVLDAQMFEIELDPELERHDFRFDALAARGDELQTAGEYDLRLQVLETRNERLYRLTVAGPSPGEPTSRGQAPAPRYWLEAILRDADGRQIFSDANAEGGAEADGRLVQRYRVQSLERGRTAAAVEVQLYLPGGEPVRRTVTFTDIPVPDRTQPEPERR